MSEIALDETPHSTSGSQYRQYWGYLSHYLKPQIPRIMVMSLLLLAGIALQLINPQVIRYFLDTAQAGGAARSLLMAALAFIAFAIVQQVMNLAARYASLNTGWSATNQMRRELALHVLQLDMPFHKQHTPGELIDRVDGDVDHLKNFFSEFTIRVLGSGLLVVGILVLLFRESMSVGAGMLLYTALTLVILRLIQGLAVSKWAVDRQAGAEMYGYIEERISGAEEVRAAGAEAHALRRLYALMRRYLHVRRAAFVVSTLTYGLTNLLYVAGYAAGLALGVYLYTRGEATLGTAYLITWYVGMLADPLQNIREQIQDLHKATASIHRIQNILDIKPQVNDPAVGMRRLAGGPLPVAFENVCFRYADHDNVLEDISFSVQPGRVLGILGRTGSGKSTLARLMFRMYDPGEGQITLDGVDIRQVSLADLRQRVGMVTQDVQLFQATVRDNLTFFKRTIPDEKLADVLKDLRLWGWVKSLPQGLDTVLASGGKGLSAGEAQLLAFTRVFLKDPGLVILDEASSRLDPSTEMLMERAVDRLFNRRTGIVIAHRLQTVQRADDILILEEGRIVEFGRRQALAADPNSHFHHLLRTGLEEVLA
ncbi:MAG TPA: ABC transporter ATP-binding protein [Levilinea sp.]|nr:ABC transporter ATP-binding protein [Levilinea sp.]